MESAIDVREYPFPCEATKPGQVDRHSYGVAGRGFSIGVLYAKEPHKDDGSLGIHVSISYVKFMKPSAVTSSVLTVVERLIKQQGLTWPERFDKTPFEAGPFAGRGVRLWET